GILRAVRAFASPEWVDAHPVLVKAIGYVGLLPEIWGINFLVHHTNPLSAALILAAFALFHIALLIKEYRARGKPVPSWGKLGFISLEQSAVFLTYIFLPVFSRAAKFHAFYDTMQIITARHNSETVQTEQINDSVRTVPRRTFLRKVGEVVGAGLAAASAV